MKCQHCKSKRLAHCGAHCSDLFIIEIGQNKHQGYVPDDLGFGGGRGGNNFVITICLDCGQTQGKFPKPLTELERITCSEEQ